MFHLVALIRALICSQRFAALTAWLGRLAGRVLARQLQMPEALVHETGLYLYRRVDAFERRLLRQLAAMTQR